MNKKVIIITAVIACLFLVIGGYVFWKKTEAPQQIKIPDQQTGNFFPPNTKNTNTDTNTNPIIPTPVTQTGPKLVLHTKNGEDVTINDFYKNQQTRLLDEKKDAVLKEDKNYYIDYLAAGQSFGISLTGDNLQTSRIAGEQDLLKILGITEYQACKLNVSVTVPGSVNENAAGQDYRLSFCPNGIPLP